MITSISVNFVCGCHNLFSVFQYVFHIFFSQIQSIIFILVMQVLAQDLSEYELNEGVGCAKGNTEANGFTPQDWTGKCKPTVKITVGKQTPCKLSFAHITVTSQRILTVQTKAKFRKFVVSFA